MNNRLCYKKNSILVLTLVFFSVLSFIANGQTTVTYNYDVQGQLVLESYQNAYSLEFEYDEEGNLISKTVSDTLSVPGNMHDEMFNVYPNPAPKGILINYAFTTDNVPDEMIIHDSNGKIIEKIPLKHAKGVLHYLRDFSPGVYILKAGDAHSKKVVILP